MKKCLFYGTLRKNGPAKKVYNFNRFGGQTYVKDWFIDGLSLYNLGYYPCVVKTGGPISNTLIRKSKDQVLCELHNVEDNSFEKIARMEKGAGYSTEVFDIFGEDVYLFYYHKEDVNVEGLEKIESGDWCSF